jgi:CheY-like chemotaxis protein
MDKRCRILIVEDSKSDVFLIREAITAARVDADLYVVNDGQAATQFFDTADRDTSAPYPDLVLLDLNLPKKTGDDVLRHLRQSERCSQASVLIVSSSDAPRDRGSVAAHSIAGYFKKPSEYADFMKLGAIVKGLLAALRSA